MQSPVGQPAAGREQRFGVHTLQPATSPGRWLVVGGGPSGMKAALTLQHRGHQVTLLERSNKLGGQVNYAAQLPRREKFGFIPRDLERQLIKAGVDIKLDTTWTADEIASFKADGVIVATGSVPPENRVYIGATRCRPSAGNASDERHQRYGCS